jgi:hypothetical protein
MIRSLQEAGAADTELDPLLTAHALSAMVSRMAYVAYVQKVPMPFEKLVETLNRIWIKALSL